MIVVPLGVSSATPTVNRNLPAVALWREGSVYLFDCGENTQLQMLKAGLKRSKIDAIFISHLDGDHFYGILGLLSTLGIQSRDRAITIVSPKGIKDFIEKSFKIAEMKLEYDLNFVELEPGFSSQIVIEDPEFYVEARPLNHSRFCVGYRFQEKDKPGKVDAKKAAELGIKEDTKFKNLKAGKDVKLDDGTLVKATDIVGEPRRGSSFAYITDTSYCQASVELAKDVNILYHESTFDQSLAEKARETGHSTASDAAKVANEAGAKLLVLGHFSGRYTNEFILMKEAKRDFKETWIANELRPIMTDPEHERGIIKPNISEPKKKSSVPGKPRKKRTFRKRTRPVGRRSFNKHGSSGTRPGKDHKSGRLSEYYRKDSHHHSHPRNNDNKDSKEQHPQYKPITPRTPFDDYDRF